MFAEMGEDGEPEFIPAEAYVAIHAVEQVVIPARPRGEAARIIQDTGIDEICRRLEAGDSIQQIARSLKVGRDGLENFLRLPENADAAWEARKESGRHWDEKAEEAIMDLHDDSGPGAVAKSRELAAHYRWRAKAYQPKRYGDKVEHTVVPMPLNEVEERLKYLLENKGG